MNSAGSSPVIETQKLRKVFRSRTKEAGVTGSIKSFFSRETTEVEAVKGIDLVVERGEVVAFIGPNGAGKSTTIKMLTGILYPSSGTARVLGHVPWLDREKLSFKIGSVFGQKSQLWYHLPPLDTFNLLARIYEMDPAEYRKNRDYLVSLFQIDEFLKTPVRKLSLGQRMRCEVAASLLHGPEVVFLDEPTIGLDVLARQNLRRVLKQWNREVKATVFLTSHDVGDIEQLADRVIIINHGEIVLDTTVKTLKHRYLHRKVIDLRLAQEAPEIARPGIVTVKAKGQGLKLEVDARIAGIDQVLSAVLKEYEVLDITISDPPLEEIIAEIYRAQQPDGVRS
ncbi:MAG TPA: ABC transporter ATP-binding protein [Firmicutes bacterium]|nr:ABC transporter ATP-binding protein [Candidatus Fermentithermobacillaceae bacterium]